ncbi:MAG TPA: AAA family ATPase [Pseudoxanthomonas sp.]
MSVLNIRPARREGARLVIMLGGVSGSGKTRTALELAHGLSNFDPGKIGFIDTENRRGSLYADVLPSPFLIGDLYAPFSPQRYIDAIHAFQKAGVEVLVIDSGSHEWEGIGGCVDIAEAGNPRLPNWNKAKGEHKRFMNALLTCDMHVILCLRAREKAKPEKQIVDGREKTVYVDMGLQAITEKNVLFEATASLMLHDAGKRQDVIKCPGELQAILGRGEGHLTAQDGQAIRRWVDGAQQLDPTVEKWRNRLLSNTERGVAHIESCWAQVPGPVQEALGTDFKKTLIASASEYEKQRTEAKDDGGLADINARIAGAATASQAPANDNKPPKDPVAASDQLY